MKRIHTFENFLNEANKMAMSYRLSNDDKHDVEQMWFELSKDSSKSRGEIVDEISAKLGINWFEISAWLKRNINENAIPVNEAKESLRDFIERVFDKCKNEKEWIAKAKAEGFSEKDALNVLGDMEQGPDDSYIEWTKKIYSKK